MSGQRHAGVSKEIALAQATGLLPAPLCRLGHSKAQCALQTVATKGRVHLYGAIWNLTSYNVTVTFRQGWEQSSFGPWEITMLGLWIYILLLLYNNVYITMCCYLARCLFVCPSVCWLPFYCFFICLRYTIFSLSSDLYFFLKFVWLLLLILL